MVVWATGMASWIVFPFLAPKEWMHGNPHPRAMHALELCELALLGVVVALLLLSRGAEHRWKAVLVRVFQVLATSAVFYLFWPIYHF